MGFLTEYEESKIVYKDQEYTLDLAYDTVLNVKRMYAEKILDDADILVEALKIFGIPERSIFRMSWSERMELLEQIFREKITGRPRPKVGQQKVLFDFEEDGEYIYASFVQAYGIDLIEQQGKLPWNRFAALFQGLPGDTKIKEIMRIRDMDIPAPNGNNQKEIQRITELKMYYALGYREDNAAEGLDRLFSTLEGLAIGCGGEIGV